MRRVLASLAMLTLLAGSATLHVQRASAATQPHVLRFTTAQDIEGLNPVLESGSTEHILGALTMAWLFRYDKNNRPMPELATVYPTKRNGGISADGKTIVFHLRRNVKWSDGVAFDGDDVVFSFDVMNNPANNVVSRDGFDQIVKLDQPDKYTVVVHLKKTFSPFLPVFITGGGGPSLLPKHLLGSLPDINKAPYNALPVGIGPFKFKEWRRGDAVEMVADPLYWRGKPKLERIVYEQITDRNTALTELQTGEIDMWDPVGGAYLSRVQAIPDVRIIRQPGFLYNHIDFNVTHPVVADKRVRQALRLAIDRRALLAKVAHGVGIIQESLVPEPYPGVAKLPFVEYNPANANALLDRAGWARGADGIRAKNGTRLSVDFATSSGTPDVDIQLELIRGWWKAVGVEMNIKRYQSALLFAPVQDGGIVYGGKFDAIAFAWGVPYPLNLQPFAACDAVPPKGQNDMRYCNHALDKIIADFQLRFDENEQNADLVRAARIIADDVPTIVQYSREDIFAFNKRLTGFHPNNITYFDDMLGVDI